MFRLSLALLVPTGLAWASSLVERSQSSVQPSWVAPLTLDGTPHEGVLGTTEDVDYYRIEVTELIEAVIYSSSELDTQGALLDSEGREIVWDDDGGGGRDFRISAVLNSGDYYLRIKQHSFRPPARAVGKYTLHATATMLSPVQLSLDGSATEGVIEPGEAGDYFRIEVTELTDAVFYTGGQTDTVGA